MRRLLPILVLMIVTGVVFGQAVNFDFTLWDDPDTVFNNPRIVQPSWESVLHYWKHPAGGLYVPLTYTWWSALGWVSLKFTGSATQPGTFHGGNILLHLAAILVIFSMLRRLMGNVFAASIGALLFALHPVQVETVAWISGGKDLLAAALALGSIHHMLQFAERNPGRRLHYALAILLFVLAILSKPSAVVAPVIGGVLVRSKHGRDIRWIAATVAPMLVIALACIVWSRAAQAQYAQTESPLWLRPLIATDALAFYLAKLIWPAKLGIIYGRTPATVIGSGVLYFTWIAPVAVAALLVLVYRRSRWPAIGAFVFVFALLPVLGLARFMFQIHSTVSDHYLYLPMFGLALAMAGIIAEYDRLWVRLGSGLMIAVLAMVSFGQLSHWRNSELLFRRAVTVNPTSATAHGILARALAERGSLEGAIPHFRRVVEISPRSRIAHANLAQAYLLAGQRQQAITHAIVALQLANPGDDTAWEEQILAQSLSGAPATAPTDAISR